MSKKRSRKAPMALQFAGMQLRVGTYKSNRRVDFSFKDAGMPLVFTREYTPVLCEKTATETKAVADSGKADGCDEVLQIGEYPPEDILPC